jgi:hypothetical protein
VPIAGNGPSSGGKLGPIFYRIADGAQGRSSIEPNAPKLIRSSLKPNGPAITGKRRCARKLGSVSVWSLREKACRLMSISEHPHTGVVVMCDYNSGFRLPEMVKRRPVVIISPAHSSAPRTLHRGGAKHGRARSRYAVPLPNRFATVLTCSVEERWGLGEGRYGQRSRISSTRFGALRKGPKWPPQISTRPAKCRNDKRNSSLRIKSSRPLNLDKFAIMTHILGVRGPGFGHPRLRPHQGPSCDLSDSKLNARRRSERSRGSTRRLHHLWGRSSDRRALA